MAFFTPLRYPGGKGQLANFIELVYQENNLLDAPYIEPYAGGAGVALALLFDEFSSHIHINDVNRSIYAFWHCVVNETDLLCSRIRSTDVTMGEWHRQRLIQKQAETANLLDLGFSTFFLNRTNRSGIIKGGVIGGKNQDGPFKIDARYNKDDLISRIQRIARYRSRISVYNMDAADFIRQILPTLPIRSLVYLDPPYYVKGQELYENFYGHADHVLISELARSVQQHWIISYDNVDPVVQMYEGYLRITYGLNYSASERYEGSEVMFFSNLLAVPSVNSPVSISKRSLNRNFSLRLGIPV